MTNPGHTNAWMGFMGAQNKLAKGRTDKEGEATMAKLTQDREAAFQALANFDQEVFQLIPGKSIETAPKIFLGTFEIEGPIQEWPPKSHLALGYKESDAPNEQAIRRMFSEFIPARSVGLWMPRKSTPLSPISCTHSGGSGCRLTRLCVTDCRLCWSRRASS